MTGRRFDLGHPGAVVEHLDTHQRPFERQRDLHLCGGRSMFQGVGGSLLHDPVHDHLGTGRHCEALPHDPESGADARGPHLGQEILDLSQTGLWSEFRLAVGVPQDTEQAAGFAERLPADVDQGVDGGSGPFGVAVQFGGRALLGAALILAGIAVVELLPGANSTEIPA